MLNRALFQGLKIVSSLEIFSKFFWFHFEWERNFKREVTVPDASLSANSGGIYQGEKRCQLFSGFMFLDSLVFDQNQSPGRKELKAGKTGVFLLYNF